MERYNVMVIRKCLDGWRFWLDPAEDGIQFIIVQYLIAQILSLSLIHHLNMT